MQSRDANASKNLMMIRINVDIELFLDLLFIYSRSLFHELCSLFQPLGLFSNSALVLGKNRNSGMLIFGNKGWKNLKGRHLFISKLTTFQSPKAN